MTSRESYSTYHIARNKLQAEVRAKVRARIHPGRCPSQICSALGVRITAWNPDQFRLLDRRNSTSLARTDVANTVDQFTTFLNRLHVQLGVQSTLLSTAKKKD